MKKQLLLFAFSALALTSCEDDDMQAYELDILKGDWKTSKTEIVSGKDGKTVLLTTPVTGCSVKDITSFSIDYSTSYTYYSGTGADCKVAGKSDGKYTYDTETKLLNIQYVNDNERPYKVEILSSSELKVLELFNAYDYNGDGVNDLVYTSYKR